MRVIVIGCGVIGVSTAYFLAKDGHEVTVIDREADIACGASFANGGILTPSMSDPWNAPGVTRRLIHYLGKENAPLLLRTQAIPSLMFWGMRFIRHSAPAHFAKAIAANAQLAIYSNNLLATLDQDIGLHYDQGPNGVMKLTRDPASFDAILSAAKAMMDAGVEMDILDSAGAVAREPALGPIKHQISGALFIPSDRSGDARKFCLGLAREAKNLGVEFLHNRSVMGFQKLGNQVERITVQVKTGQKISQESYEADVFVLAAGSWTSELARKLRLKVHVKPVKGYSISPPINGWVNAPRIPVADEDFHAVVTPLGDRLRVAGTAEFTGFDDTVRMARIENLISLLLALYPDFKPYYLREAIQPWCGFRPMSADGIPFIGQTAIKNLYLNTGHGHLGWTMAAGSGRLAADIVGAQKPAIDPSAYNPMR